MKQIVTIAALFISGNVLAQTTPAVDPHAGHNHGNEIKAAPQTVPVLKPADESLVLEETEYDFGKIPQGKPVTHAFKVINKGKDSLRILSVQPACGCTTPIWEQNKAVAPGKSTIITLGFNAGTVGVFNKPVTVTYNDNSSKVIYIKGEVWATPPASAPEKKTDNGM